MPSQAINLTAEQRRMYRMERMMNFRWIYQMLARKSQYVLTTNDLASAALHSSLSAIGQWAELPYACIEPEFILRNIALLSQTHYPLEGYDTLASSILVASFTGKVADVKGLVAYKPSTKQLVLSISGTQTLTQAIYDLRFFKHRCRGEQFRVHTGFWKLYKGVRLFARDGLKKGLENHDVDELIITGHSMGGAVGYLLVIDLLGQDHTLPPGLRIKLVTFGSPRVGDESFVASWNKLVDDYHTRHGPDSLQDYCVKAYNDGVPLLPPFDLRYRHCTKHPLYFYHGRLFHVPESEHEFSLFDVAMSTEELEAMPPLHPKGGHNYYNSRDMEKLTRRMEWLDQTMSKDENWMDLYQALVLREECYISA